MFLDGLNVEAVGRPRGWHDQIDDGQGGVKLGPEYIGIWIEIRYQQKLKIRLMVKWSRQNTLDVVCPRGFGMSDELRAKVGEVAQAAIVKELSALELKQMVDRNARAIDKGRG